MTNLSNLLVRLGQPAQVYASLSTHSVTLIAAGTSLVAYGSLVWLHIETGTLRAGTTPQTLGWYTLAFIAYLGTLWWAERRCGLSLKLVWTGAIAFRVLLLFTVPTLSDDVYRYMWDGYVAANGVSPYAYPIDSPVLDYLDTPQRALANNSWMASPYLPAAQYLFAGLAGVIPNSPLPFQMSMVVLDLLNGVVLIMLLRLINLPDHRVLIYLWNPLIIVEAAHGAHVDTWMIFLSLLALWFTLASRRPRAYAGLASIVLALATLTKVLPALLLAVLFWRWRWWQFMLYGLVMAVLLLPAGLAAGWGLTGELDGTGLFGAIRIYADQWKFNSGLFHWLEWILAEQGNASATRWAKQSVGLLMTLTLLWVWLTARHIETPRPLLRLAAVPLMAYVLLTPTVHPWYVMSLLALTPFLTPRLVESRWRWLAIGPWLYLSWALAFSYLTYLDPLNFRELEWVRRLEWWPTWALLVVWLGPALKPQA